MVFVYTALLGVCVNLFGGIAVGVLCGGLSDLVQHELGDWVGECRGHGQQGRLGLETILIGDELHFNGGAVRGGVAVRVNKVL